MFLVIQDDRIDPSGWHHRVFKGHYGPPLFPEERADKEAKRIARQQNDSRMEVLLRQLAAGVGQSHQQA